uniref:Glutathione peroxidase n=1 Tax=Pan paniscus TaxID=9597 RepID=A0A2R9C348_PANPA
RGRGRGRPGRCRRFQGRRASVSPPPTRSRSLPASGSRAQPPVHAPCSASFTLQCASRDDWRCARSMHEFSAKDIDGHMVNLDKYRWALAWGKTEVNYTQLVDLHARYAECGLRILAFPCNQFGKQEPGSNEEIKEFAAGYNVKFDMFSKICVNGDDAHPLWKWMKIQPKGKGILGNAIKWNFTKFLIDKNGCVVKRYGPMEEPLVIEKDLPHYF